MNTPNYKNMTIAAVAASILAGALSGCAHISQARDHVEPVAVPVMRYEQTLNPEAGKNRKVVAGLDGSAGANVQEGYAKSFVPAKGTSFTSFQGLQGLSSD